MTGTPERTATVSGDTAGLTHHPGITTREEATASDVFYGITFVRRTLLRATVTASGWQPTLALRAAGCSSNDLTCSNAARNSNSVLFRVAAGSHVFVVGGRGASDRGPFSLSVSAVDNPRGRRSVPSRIQEFG